MMMKKHTYSHIIQLKLAVMALLLAPLLISCGIHYSVEGNVVDAKTGKPVQGAVVSVNWQRTHFLGIPGLPVPRENYGTFESITDANGAFKIPKYLIGHHFMAVYKKGCICWASDTVFNPQGKNWNEMFKRVYSHKIKSNMKVKLKLKTADFPKVRHASFVQTVGTRLSHMPTPMFYNATIEERKIYRDDIRRQMRTKTKEK